MQQNPDSSEYSVIEELDPEPRSNVGLSHLREFALALVLLLGVLAWSGWQWWHQQDIQNHYRLGQQALERREWEEAHLHFTAAEAYRDAKDRATEAFRQIVERDTQYRAAVHFASREDWVSSLKATQAVNRIQPGFRDVSSMSLETERHIHREALSGTIATRLGIGQPGLYYSSDGNWRGLQGSDLWSAVRGFGPPGYVVYDVPGQGADTAPGTSYAPEETPGTRELQGRRLVVAALGSRTLRFTHLAFDPAEHDYYVWGDSGVWALRYRSDGSRARQRISSLYGSFNLTYQPFDFGGGSQVTRPVVLPGAEWLVADLSRDGEKMLLVELAGMSENPTSRLYLADGGGSERRLLFAFPGRLQGAQFSPDGRYVLVTNNSSADSTDRLIGGRNISFLDVSSTSPEPYRLAIDAQAGQGEPSDRVLPAASFVTGGPHEGRILLAEWSYGRGMLALIDPSPRTIPGLSPAPATLLTIEVDSAFPTAGLPQIIWPGYGDDGSMVLAWDGPPSTGTPNTVTVVKVAPDKTYTISNVPLGSNATLDEVSVRGSFLVLGSRTNETGDQEANRLVRSLPLSALDKGEAEPVTIYSAPVPDYLSLFASTYNPGAGMLAYSQDSKLHVHTYSGNEDVTLGGEVSVFYRPFPYLTALWMR